MDVQQSRAGIDREIVSLEEALSKLGRMAELPLVEDYICFLQKCRKTKNLAHAKLVHGCICKNGLESHRALGNHIVPMFVECGSVSDAQQVFDRLIYRNVHSWTSLILGYMQCAQMQHALNLYQKMQEDGVLPTSYTLTAILKTCARLKDLERGRKVHAEISGKGFKIDRFVGSSLVDMYAKCGSLSEAQEVLGKLQAPDVVSWNALIAGYAEHGPGEEALNCLEQMQLGGVFPDAITFACVLKACGSIGSICKGRAINAEIVQKELEKDLLVSNTLINMYSKCGSLSEAQGVFDKLSVRDVVSWNALIAGYAEQGFGQEALECFEQMQLESISRDAITFVYALKACGSMKAIGRGKEIHAEITQKGFEREPSVGNALVDMYAKCGSLSDAQDVFDKMPIRNVMLWNTLIIGYAEHGPGQKALKCFEQMLLEGISPDAVMFVCILKACGSIGAVGKGREIHLEISKKGFERDLFVGNTLVDMYAKCGLLSEAQGVFDKLSGRDVVSWTALIAGYAEHGAGHEALKCYKQMQLEGISPNAVTVVCALKACGSLGAIDKGREIHMEAAQKGLGMDLSIGNTLVDTYSKCGSLLEAWGVFDSLPVRDVVSWTAIINGYGINHEGNMAVQCFEDMKEQCVRPDAVAFTALLTACSHTNLVLKGKESVRLMRREYGIALTIDHCICVVDLLAQSGHLHEAEEFLESMWWCPSQGPWTALLSSCKIYEEAELGFRCFQQLVQMGLESATLYVLMANIYATAGRWDDAYRVEEMRKHAGVEESLQVL